MLTKKKISNGKYVKAKTPEAKRKQKAAIIGYYINKKKEENSKKKPWE